MVCNKVVCFTHTSLEVHGLPGFSSAHNIEDLIFINTRRVIFDNVSYTCVYMYTIRTPCTFTVTVTGILSNILNAYMHHWTGQ